MNVKKAFFTRLSSVLSRPRRNPLHGYRLVTVTEAEAVLVVSAFDVALSVTVAGFGTVLGALYRPLDEIVPTVPLPPTIPFTFHVTDVLADPCTVAVNCRVCFTRTDALVGEIATVTVTAMTSTNAEFDTAPSGVVTITGTDVFGVLALPAAVSFVVETNVVGRSTPSKLTVAPETKPLPFTVSVNVPVATGDGLTDVMLGKGKTVTVAAPFAVGVLTLVARTVTTFGLGTVVGARYRPLLSIVPTVALPPVTEFTLHVTPPVAPVTVAVNSCS